jgi:hypothetical protein
MTFLQHVAYAFREEIAARPRQQFAIRTFAPTTAAERSDIKDPFCHEAAFFPLHI